MKKLALIGLLLAGCSKTPEQKALALSQKWHELRRETAAVEQEILKSCKPGETLVANSIFDLVCGVDPSGQVKTEPEVKK